MNCAKSELKQAQKPLARSGLATSFIDILAENLT